MIYKTEQRNKLYDLLKSHPHEQFSVKEISDALSDSDISVSAIYRNLGKLVSDGVVRKSIRGNSRETVYQYIACDACRGEIHLTCTGCGKSFHMNHLLAEMVQNTLANSDGFQIDAGKTILYGTCQKCSNPGSKKS